MILSRLSSSLIPCAYGLIFRDGFRNLLLILTCCLPSACSMNGQSQRVEPVDAATTLTLKKKVFSAVALPSGNPSLRSAGWAGHGQVD